MALQTLQKSHTPILSPFSISTLYSPLSFRALSFSRTPISLSLSVSLNSSSHPTQTEHQAEQDAFEEDVIGDCLVFEEDAFEDPFLRGDEDKPIENNKKKIKSKATVEAENLVPEKWAEAQAEYNISKKERRKISQQIEFGSRIERKSIGVPVKETQEFLSYRELKLSQLKPRVLDDPDCVENEEIDEVISGLGCSSTARVAPRNPRLAVYGRGLDDISEFFNSGNYSPGEKKSEGHRKLFTKEEKVLLNKRVPNLADATSEKWLPLHTLAASGEFYLVDALLKHNVDINAADKDGLTALHRAIICKKQAVTNYLLRESANPLVRDKEGATLMHYAVQTASIPTVKILLLYNVDINLADDYGWTPLHLAVQTRRTDLVKLLLIKGADKTLRNQDGLTPIDLCLYSGQHARTYELIKLLKQLPKSQLPKHAIVPS